ncbi:F-box domain-containing protein [Dioscorea alata]|uniref:F-box domain-containing protein n=1 Tax=Dioscorea alata TaxID=55571 RepID=A0ACB7UE30_DIOAL|nr:F-box domain-containing protein [Dioscorea alata]
MVDYARLPRDMIQEIVKYFSFLDYIRFGAVCSHWCNVAKERYSSSQKLLPWLIFFNGDSPKFFNPSEERVYHMEIPKLSGRHCAGSSHGWLITIDLDFKVYLLNPFSRAQVGLPPLQQLDTYDGYPRWDQLIYKAVLSADPSESFDYIVIVVYFRTENLAFWRPGDLTWTMIRNHIYIEDIIWYNEGFYVVGSDNHIVNKYGGDEGNDDEDGFAQHYPNAVNARHFMHTTCFKLFKFDRERNNFVKLNSIDDHILFLGANHTMMIATTAMGEKIKSNSIYFTDHDCWIERDHMHIFRDSGIYNISDRSITLFPLKNINHQAKRPIFIDVN